MESKIGTLRNLFYLWPFICYNKYLEVRVRLSMAFLPGVVFLSMAAGACYSQTKNGFDLSESTVDPGQIEYGGPGRDGIPSIDAPRFQTAEEASWLRDGDRVIGVAYRNVIKAYPIRILNWHEIANDEFNGWRVLVTYCPLCYTGMVFDVHHQEVDFTFGVSGLLYNSDVLLYDRQTESLWSQIKGEAVAGPLKGTKLTLLPTRHTTWKEWREEYPETLVLSRDTGHRRNYSVSPYLQYERTQRLMFDVEHESGDYREKDLVLGISIGDQHKAYPFPELEEHGIAQFEDAFAGQTLTVAWSEESNSAHVFDETGHELPSVIAYWFAWYAFHPDTEIFRASD